MKRRVRNLVIKATDTDFDNEKDAFMSKATALAVEHGISMASLFENRDVKRTATEIRIPLPEGPYVTTRRSGYCWVADAFGASAYFRLGADEVTFCCTPAQQQTILAAVSTYDLWLLVNLDKQVIPSGVHARTFRCNFVEGYWAEIASRIRKEQRRKSEESAENHSAALVVIDEDKMLVKEYMSKVKLRTFSSVNRASSAGHSQGRSAGASHFVKGVSA